SLSVSTPTFNTSLFQKLHVHHHHHHRHHPHLPKPPLNPETLDISIQGTTLAMKKMLEVQFPRIDVIFDNYPPSLSKSLLSKVVPVFKFGVIWIMMAREQIFPMIGIMTPPLWYYSLRANSFGSIVTAWLLGNVM
ncbi:hypothetical protein Gotri_007558, partial [Gossypium trilobum]|nr:hypothetical protein [Gossypium trilobum]